MRDSPLSVGTNILVSIFLILRRMVKHRQRDTTDTSSAATMEVWQHKIITDIDCKQQVLCQSLRTKGSLCFRATWTLSKRRGRNPSWYRQTFLLLQKLQHSRGLLKGILGNTENHYVMYGWMDGWMDGWSRLRRSEDTKKLNCNDSLQITTM